ncbi:MAG: dipeptidase [Planctomycetes bacterium]|nr:dipeptidase [Planctomycetota bacterium]
MDIPRLREGGYDAVFFAVWAPGPVEPGAGVAAARRQVDCIKKAVADHADDLALAGSAADIRAARATDKISIVIAIEGGYLIEDSLDVLREYRALGAAYMTLTHGFHTSWADSSGIHRPIDPRHGGLTDFGRVVVREMNRIGMMVDVSHVSDATFRDVLEAAEKPVLATHSCCRALSPHPRNLSDEMMKALADTGGLMQINFAAGFLDPDFPDLDPDDVEAFFAAGCRSDEPLTDYVTPFSLLVDHFDHALQVIGPDHVGIGSDFDGVPAVPEGMEDCGKLVNLTASLMQRGYDEDDLLKVLGGNVLRMMDACQATIGASHPNDE